MLSKRFLKHSITVLVTVVILFCGAARISSASPKRYRQAALKLPKISISIYIGRASKKCAGFGICKITLGTVSARTLAQRIVKGELVANDDGKLQLVLLEKAPGEEGTLFIDQDIVLSRSGAQRLGFKAVTIRKGEYAFGDSKSLLNARVTKLAQVTR